MTTPPSYRKVNPADAPVLFVALTSPSMSAVGPERLRREPDLAHALDARRRGAGQRLRPEALRGARARAARRAGGAQHHPRRAGRRRSRAANANTPGRHAGRPAPDADHPGQPAAAQRGRVRQPDRRHAATATRCGCATWPRSRTASRPSRPASWVNGERVDLLAIQRQPDANTVAVVDAVRAALPALPARSCRPRCRSTWSNDRSVSIRDAHPRREPHAGAHRRAGGAGDLPVPAPLRRDRDPGAVAADLADRRAVAAAGPSATASTTSRCSASRSPSAWWWTTRSSCWRTSCATSRTAWRRSRRR